MIKQDIYENQVKVAYLGIGSNLGNKNYNIETAKFNLQFYNIKILKCSSNYESLSWPDPTKPKFINIIVKIETSLSPIELLKICNLIELKLGRKRSVKNKPRTCDIDIIDYDQKIFEIKKNPNLNLPHPGIEKRNFVLIPLFEISKSWKHPKTKVNIGKLINSMPIDDLRSIKAI